MKMVNRLPDQRNAWSPAPNLGTSGGRSTDLRSHLCFADGGEYSYRQSESAGWVAPRGRKHGALAESVGGQIIFKLCTETKAVPGAVVKAEVEAKLEQIEAATGRPPKGKSARQIKEEVNHSLMPRAFPKRASTQVWLDPKAGLVLIDAASMKKADAVVTRLVELLGGDLLLTPVQTALAPATAIANSSSPTARRPPCATRATRSTSTRSASTSSKASCRRNWG